jgi:hypothetical protein
MMVDPRLRRAIPLSAFILSDLRSSVIPFF